MIKRQSFFDENIGRVDLSLRVVIGAAFISVLLFSENVFLHQWQLILALFGAYLINSAIVHWDPVYAILKEIWSKVTALTVLRPTRIKPHAA